MRQLALVLLIGSLACGGTPHAPAGKESVDPTGGAGGDGGGGAGGETAGGGAGGTGMPDAAATGTGGTGGPMLGFYEAEAVKPAGPNELIAPAVVSNCPNMSPTCAAPDAVKPETPCCFQGKEVRQLLRGKGGLVFNEIAAPADGTYD